MGAAEWRRYAKVRRGAIAVRRTVGVVPLRITAEMAVKVLLVAVPEIHGLCSGQIASFQAGLLDTCKRHEEIQMPKLTIHYHTECPISLHAFRLPTPQTHNLILLTNPLFIPVFSPP